MEAGDAGMTIREHMATQIMAGFGLGTPESAATLNDMATELGTTATAFLAEMAVGRAEALIAALNEIGAGGG